MTQPEFQHKKQSGIDLTARTIVDVMRITLHETGRPNDMKTRYGMLKLKIQVIAR